MARPVICREPDCDLVALNGAVFCNAHIATPRRCKATKPGSDGKVRCRRNAMRGLEVCHTHGGHLPNARRQHERAEALTEMQRFTRIYEGDVDPISVFEIEFRRTLGRISWYDEQLSRLKLEDLTWGRTKRESGLNDEGMVDMTTYEAKINMYEEMQRWERKHLVELEKVWMGAKLDERKLDLMKRYVELAQSGVERALAALGVDLTRPEVPEILSAVFLELLPPELPE